MALCLVAVAEAGTRAPRGRQISRSEGGVGGPGPILLRSRFFGLLAMSFELLHVLEERAQLPRLSATSQTLLFLRWMP